jgi:hypothetical protein
MNTKQVISIGAMVALVGSLGIGVSFGAGDSQSSEGTDNQPSAFGRSGNQGEGFSDEHTKKGRNPASSSRQDAQTTLGGARPVVEGQVLNVQGDDYLIKDSGGSEVHLRVNKDTNMDCAAAGGHGASMSTGRHIDEQGEIPPTSHMQEQMNQQSAQAGSQEEKGQEIVRQSKGDESDTSRQSGMSGERIGDQSGTQSRSAMGKDSGGDIARGSGFTIGSKGDCAFKAGDKVRAEVSDLGTVLYLKQVSDKDTKAQHRSGQMIPEDRPRTQGDRSSAEQTGKIAPKPSAETSLKPEAPDRGKPGINSGGQVISPGEGEQSGRPGTVFGGSATLPPGGAPQYEGADKQKGTGK